MRTEVCETPGCSNLGGAKKNGSRRPKCTTCMQGKENKRERNRLYQQRNRRAGNIRTKYGITVTQYQEMLERQEGKCKICGLETPGHGAKHMPVDHDHITGEVRALLCVYCNRDVAGLESLINRNLIDKGFKYLEDYA